VFRIAKTWKDQDILQIMNGTPRQWNVAYIDDDFLCRIKMAQQLRERIGKWDYMKLKSSCTTKEMVTRLKR
jgi:hypothetical protein